MTKKQPRPKEFCPICKIGYWQKAEKRSIQLYKKCSKCILEEAIGHEYIPPTWECPVCNRSFLSPLTRDRHQDRYDHFLSVNTEIK